MISNELIAILCCPLCHSDVRIDVNRTTVICSHCNKEFIIKDNIPIMIPLQTTMNREATKEDGK